MNEENLRHSTLGEITPEMQAGLAAMDNGLAVKGKADCWTAAQRAVLADVASLQVKARRTFGQPGPSPTGPWWVTRRGLQQSTHFRVARLKASWMGTAPVADLCCGLGSDSIALAGRGETLAFDVDPDVLAFAQANLRAAGLTASLRMLDVERASIPQLLAGAEFLHIDPDRRADGNRHTDASHLVPPWTRVRELVDACRGALVKLAPATELSGSESASLHRTWISTSGSVREQTAIFGDILERNWLLENAMHAGNRSAIVIRGETVSVFSAQFNPDASSRSDKTGIQQWLIDPDAAIRAAGLTEAFGRATASRPVAANSGFLTSDSIELLSSWRPMATLAKVVEVVGCDERKLKRFFRARNGYPEIIKVRGADIDPGKLQRRLKTCGETPFGLWIGRQGKRTFAAITELPLTGSPVSPGQS